MECKKCPFNVRACEVDLGHECWMEVVREDPERAKRNLTTMPRHIGMGLVTETYRQLKTLLREE